MTSLVPTLIMFGWTVGFAAINASRETRYFQAMPPISSPFFTSWMRGVAVGDGKGVTVGRTVESGEPVMTEPVGWEIYGVNWPALVARATGIGVAAGFAAGEHAARKITVMVTRPACLRRQKLRILGSIWAIIPFFDFANFYPLPGRLAVAARLC